MALESIFGYEVGQGLLSRLSAQITIDTKCHQFNSLSLSLSDSLTLWLYQPLENIPHIGLSKEN